MSKISNEQVTRTTYLGTAVALGGAYALGRGWHKLGLSLTVGGVGIPLYLRKQYERRGPARFLEDDKEGRQTSRIVPGMQWNELQQVQDSIGWKAGWIGHATDFQFKTFFLEKCSCDLLWQGVGDDPERRRLILEKFDDLAPLEELLDSLPGDKLRLLFEGLWEKAAQALSEEKLGEVVLEAICDPSSWIEMAKRLKSSGLHQQLLTKVEGKIRTEIESRLIGYMTRFPNYSEDMPLPSPDMPDWVFAADTLPYLVSHGQHSGEKTWRSGESFYVVIKAALNYSNRFEKPNIKAVMGCVEWLELPRVRWDSLLCDGLKTVGKELWKHLDDDQQRVWRESLEKAITNGTLDIHDQANDANEVLTLFGSKETVKSLLTKK